MKVFSSYLSKIDNLKHRERTKEVLKWVNKRFPNLKSEIRWNHPMFTDHNTFIIGFSVSKNHLAISPESKCINHFSDEIIKSGYNHTKNLIRIKWEDYVDYDLIERIIEYNIKDKEDCLTFWRK